MEIENNLELESDLLKPTGFIKKNIAGLLDAVIFLFTAFMIAQFLPAFLQPVFNIFVLFILYRAACIFALGGTLGMTLCNTVFLKPDQTDLTSSEKIAAACFILLNGTRYYDK